MKIIVSSEDRNGITFGALTKVTTEDGVQIKDISEINIKYRADSIVMAELHMYVSPGTIETNAILSLDSVKEAADHHGYVLFKK